MVDQQFNDSALTHFDYYAENRRSPEGRQRVQKQFLAAWKAGCHPDARWLRRRGLVLALAGSKLSPMARDLAAQKQIQATMDLRAPLDHEDRSTPETNWMYLLRSVVGHEGDICLCRAGAGGARQGSSGPSLRPRRRPRRRESVHGLPTSAKRRRRASLLLPRPSLSGSDQQDAQELLWRCWAAWKRNLI